MTLVGAKDQHDEDRYPREPPNRESVREPRERVADGGSCHAAKDSSAIRRLSPARPTSVGIGGVELLPSLVRCRDRIEKCGANAGSLELAYRGDCRSTG